VGGFGAGDAIFSAQNAGMFFLTTGTRRASLLTYPTRRFCVDSRVYRIRASPDLHLRQTFWW